MNNKGRPIGPHTMGPIQCGAYRRAAKDRYLCDTETEVDDHAEVSRPADAGGAWVQAWVWVPDSEAMEAPEIGGN